MLKKNLEIIMNQYNLLNVKLEIIKNKKLFDKFALNKCINRDMFNDISKKKNFSDTDTILNLDTYDRFTYLISKFNKSNVYVKIRLTDFLYSSIYFDINNLVNISSRISKKNKIYNTIIPSSYLNNAVYALTNNDDLSNLSYVSRKILNVRIIMSQSSSKV